MVKILTLDGGGIRGIITSIILAELENRTGQPIADLFDLIVGTSTGGILAAALASPGADGRPRLSAAELVDLYEGDGPRIFSRSAAHAVRSLHNLTGPKYPADRLEAVLRNRLGAVRLRETLTDVMLTAYELEMRTPFFFRTSRAREDPAYDWELWETVRATTAAPTYFPPVRLEADPSDSRSHYALIDGGVYANNPAMVAYAEGRTRWPDEELLLLSVGTGKQTRHIRYEDARGWGLARWARPLLDIVFDGVSSTVDYEVGRLLEREGRYWRLDAPLTDASDAIDDTSAQNRHALRNHAELLVGERERDLEQIVAALAE